MDILCDFLHVATTTLHALSWLQWMRVCLLLISSCWLSSLCCAESSCHKGWKVWKFSTFNWKTIESSNSNWSSDVKAFADISSPYSIAALLAQALQTAATELLAFKQSWMHPEAENVLVWSTFGGPIFLQQPKICPNHPKSSQIKECWKSQYSQTPCRCDRSANRPKDTEDYDHHIRQHRIDGCGFWTDSLLGRDSVTCFLLLDCILAFCSIALGM